MAKFAINNKFYTATKISPFIANYEREVQIEMEFRRKEKMEIATEFVERMRKIQEKARAVLKKA